MRVNSIKKSPLILSFLWLMGMQNAVAQEWKDLRGYTKSTGRNVLQEGCWLQKDRIENTATWKQANKYNLGLINGHFKYTSIRQIRDFYRWFDQERKIVGIDQDVVGIMAIVAGQLSYFDNGFIRHVMVRNKEVIWFGNEGSRKVLAYAFPFLKQMYEPQNIPDQIRSKKDALLFLKIEQCQIVEMLYQELSPQAIKKLTRIAQGRGMYGLGVKKELKFEGDITDCEVRYAHVLSKLYPYYLNNLR